MKFSKQGSKMALTDLSALNTLQADAVTSVEKRVLVLAGAGSGKTKTLLQKLIWLIEEKGVSPSEILAITFTKNAANEMVDRLIAAADHSGTYLQILNEKRLSRNEKENQRKEWKRKYRWIDHTTVRTFHSFCYSVLRNYGVNQFDNQFRIIGDEKRDADDETAKFAAAETVFEVFHKLLIERCGENQYLLDLKRYILDYLVDRRNQAKTANTTVPHPEGLYTTLDGKKVRSKSEQYIADWLYRHSIRYEYEPLLNIRDFYFHPDFYIPDANLYIEHVSDKSYEMRDKEEQFKKGKVLYVKTYEKMTHDSALFNYTLETLIRGRLPAKYHYTVALNYNEEFQGYMEEVKEFITQVIRVTDMIKIENDDLDDILLRGSTDQHERIRDFYRLAIPLIRQYMKYCVDKSYLDFNDMITQSIRLLKNQEDIAGHFRKRYRYILVDEFQDVNNLQVELLKLLLTDSTQLFCVGDDWQSIYGFRGSDVSYIIEFEKHFPGAKVIKLNLNYRSHQHIVGASNEVISHNKFRIEKEIIASKRSEHKIVIYAGNNQEENLRFCVDTVKELLEGGLPGEEILFLYRRSKMYDPYFQRFKEERIRINAKTIHAAKGLEAAVVFIVGLTDGSGGFPDVWLEDRVFQIIRRANHDLLLEEERRLFYVALTRARDKLYLITEKGFESSFLKEIPEEYTVKSTISVQPVVEKVITCRNCFSVQERLWKVCPYCGSPVVD
jgi:superfamily I DNA/RNA helicase